MFGIPTIRDLVPQQRERFDRNSYDRVIQLLPKMKEIAGNELSLELSGAKISVGQHSRRSIDICWEGNDYFFLVSVPMQGPAFYIGEITSPEFKETRGELI